MNYPRTCQSFRRTKSHYPLSIVPSTETLPSSLAVHNVCIRIHAVSLNFRDVAMLREGLYPIPVEPGGIPASDCAAEVVAVGTGVEYFSVGDHVAPTINLSYLTGDEKDAEAVALGGDGPGVLTEYAVFDQKHLVKLPLHLSWEEASTITCAGVTAWTSLDSLSGLEKGTTVLLQGTGGVSMFGLIICLAASIQPIITSSSDAKLEKLKKLSPQIRVINYKKHSNYLAEVLRLTDNKGVDYIINNTGLASMPSEIDILRKRGGTISLVGFLEGLQANWSPEVLFTLLKKAAKVQGILGGSRKDFEALNRFLESSNVYLNPLIDRIFDFKDSAAAFEYLYSQKHVGKVVIKLDH